MVKFNVMGALWVALVASSWSSCDHKKHGLDTCGQGNAVRYDKPAPKNNITKAKVLDLSGSDQTKVKALDLSDPDQLFLKVVLYGNRAAMCNLIKRDAVALARYRRFMGGDPTPDDVGKCILAICVFFTERKKLIVELGKKVTHPVFDVKPDFRAFIAHKLAFNYKVSLDAPVDEYVVKCWDRFRKDLEQFRTVICNLSLFSNESLNNLIM